MAYFPVVPSGPSWPEIAEAGNIDDIAIELTTASGMTEYTVPDEYILRVEWVYETDVSGQTTPLDEMDVTLSNSSGMFDVDNPDGISDRFRQNNYIAATLVVHSGANEYSFPMGVWIIAEREYHDDNVVLVCYDTSLPLTTSTDSVRSVWDRYGTFVDNIKACYERNGVLIDEFVKYTAITPRQDIRSQVLASFQYTVESSLTDVVLYTGTVCFANRTTVDSESIPGLTLRVVGSAIMQIKATGIPVQIGYYYIPIFNISDLAFLGYIEFGVFGFGIGTGSPQILATFLQTTDDPSYVSENPTVSEQMRTLMKTIFEPYDLKNTREGGYRFAPYIHKAGDKFAGYFDNRVLEFPQLTANEYEATNVLGVEYFSPRDVEGEPVNGMVTKEYRGIQPTDVAILRNDISLAYRQIALETAVDYQLTGEFWADRIANAFFQSGIRYPTFTMNLACAPEIEPKDFIFVQGRYGTKPYYVKKVTMTYDGGLTSEIEGLLLDVYNWNWVKSHTWQVIKDNNTWGDVLTIYKDFK